MKKKVILLSLILIISILCFIPVSQQKTTIIKAPFLATYAQLANAANWENWRPDLYKAVLTDSNKISIKKDTTSFAINYADLKINVKMAGNLFNINEQKINKSFSYSYTVLPGKLLNQTLITLDKNTNVINYLIGKFKPVSFSDTHIADFKKFMETDSLYYGCNIFKTGVPGGDLIVIRRAVLAKNKFTEASKMLATLQQYVKTNGIQQINPVIAQFLRKGKDSSQVNVGFFINKEAKSNNGIEFVRMPKGGPLFAAKFKGRFNGRQKIYNGLQQYFADRHHQPAILPFETYFDDKFPSSDTDKINIQINFSSYY